MRGTAIFAGLRERVVRAVEEAVASAITARPPCGQRGSDRRRPKRLEGKRLEAGADRRYGERIGEWVQYPSRSMRLRSSLR